MPNQMREVIGRCHVCIVPTRSEFAAGFEMTCAEAVLSGRPLVTSAACPALHYLPDATLEVEPNNIDQYRDALLALKDDLERYRKLQSACSRLSLQFFDEKKSWEYAMRQALSHVL